MRARFGSTVGAVADCGRSVISLVPRPGAWRPIVNKLLLKKAVPERVAMELVRA